MINIPEDIVEYIIKFKFDRRGYEIFDYYDTLKKNKNKIYRLNNEFKYWNNILSIGSDTTKCIQIYTFSGICE
mgnify:CR=1 FL=1|jgi:hypothetical protein